MDLRAMLAEGAVSTSSKRLDSKREPNQDQTSDLHSSHISGRYHGGITPAEDAAVGHTYGNASVDGSGVTIFGNVTHNYFFYGTKGQWELAGQTSSFRHEAAYLDGSNFDHSNPAPTYSSNRSLSNLYPSRPPQSDPYSNHQDLQRVTSPFRENEPLVSVGKVQRRLQNLGPREYANAQPEREPGIANSISLTSHQKLQGSLVLGGQSMAPPVEQTVLVINNSRSEALDRVRISMLKKKCNVISTNSYIDAMSFLRQGSIVTAVFFQGIPDNRPLEPAEEVAFYNALVAYAKKGANLIISCMIYAETNNEFFEEQCQLKWRPGKPSSEWNYFHRNREFDPGCPYDLPDSVEGDAMSVKNVARCDLIYAKPESLLKDLPHRMSSGPFALSRFGQGRIGWFGHSLSNAESHPVLLFMLGLTD